tara:strand:+ start:11839 stop:13359 length:1521 start_codon:yes stop_codon:yes gene_type:complete
MARIPTYRRVATIPGPQGMAMPRATPAAFGSLEARQMAQGGLNISDWAIKETKTKIAQEAQIYSNKLLSSTRAKMTERANILRRTTDGDIAPVIHQEMLDEIALAQTNAPSQLAADKVGMGLRTMMGTFRAREINQDSVFRDKRLLLSNDEAHQNDKSTVYNNYNNLELTMQAAKARINALNLPPILKQEMMQKQLFELGYDAIRGQIDVGEVQAQQMLKELNNPTRDEYFKGIIDAKNKQSLTKYANTTIRQYQSERRSNEAAARLAHSDKQREITSYWVDRILDPMVPVTIEEMRTYEDSDGNRPDGRTLATLKQHLNTLNKPTSTTTEEKLVAYTDLQEQIDFIKSDPETYGENIFLQEESILNSLNDGGISLAMYNSLLKQLKEPLNMQKKLFLAAQKQAIVKGNPMLGIKDPKGAELYMEAEAHLRRLMEEAEADENLDIMDLFNPDHEKYAGKKLKQYHRSAKDIIRDAVQSMRPTDATTPSSQPTDDTVTRIKRLFGIQ